MNRREFMKMAAMAGAAAPAAIAAAGTNAKSVKAGGRLRICAFADIHFNPGTWPHGDIEYLEKILARAEAEKTDFTIHLGDFTHRTDRQDELDYIKRYNTFGQPTYHTLGNHDGERGEGGYRKAMELYGMKSNCYSFDRNGWRFIVADPNYFLLDGQYVHYEGRNLYAAVKTGRMKSGCCIPPEQVEWIKDTVANSPFPCVFMSHESIERRWAVTNGPEIRRFFDETNAKTPGKVRLVINGHHHCDHVSVVNGIVYFDMNSANYMYFAKTHDRFPKEYIKKAAGATHCIVWNDPLSAIISLDENSVKILGSSSTYYLGITPESAGYKPLDEAGRAVVPMISSFEYMTSSESYAQGAGDNRPYFMV